MKDYFKYLFKNSIKLNSAKFVTLLFLIVLILKGLAWAIFIVIIYCIVDSLGS